jgi:FkbM family methyltransferase
MTSFAPGWLRQQLKRLYLGVPFKRELFSIVKKGWTPPEGLSRHLYFNGPFRVDVDGRHFLINNGALDVEPTIFWEGLTGNWEKVSLSAWIRLAQRSATIVDVGANTGVYSLAAKAVNPAARVYGFEPVTRVFERYRANVALNHYDVDCRELALSNYDGEGVIYDLPIDQICTVTVNKNTYPADWPVTKTTIATRRLATFIEQERLPDIDLIKIDVESHEAEVLEGMGEHLHRMKPTLLVEVWNDQVGRKVEELVEGAGYEYFATDETRPFARQPHIRNEHPERGYLNYLICQAPVAAWLFESR